MNRYFIPGFFLLLVIAMSLVCGCEEEEPVATPTPTTPTPTPEPTPVPTPVLSSACLDLLAAADTDSAFLKSIRANDSYGQVYTLAYKDCQVSYATKINDNMARGPKPKTPVLADARKYLMSASAYCLEPTLGTSRGRTRDDMNLYIGKMNDYNDLVFTCVNVWRNEKFAQLEEHMTALGTTTLRNSGSMSEKLKVRNDGNRTFLMTYEGEGPFLVTLQDVNKKNITIIDRAAGPFSGTIPQKLPGGYYYIYITAGGPWNLSVFNP